MTASTSFSRLSLWETKSNYSNERYTCLKTFRSGDRRRHLKLDVTVCAACHRSHVHFLSVTSGLEDGSIMDVDMHGDHVVCDVATQTEFDLFGPETAIPATAMPSSMIKKEPLATNFETDSIRLPFFRISNSHNRCPICKKYFIDCHYSATNICDSIRATSLINHRIFIPENSRCCSTHLDADGFNLSALHSIKKYYENTCSIKINELMQIFENVKTDLKTRVSYRKINNRSCKIYFKNAR